jgi:hypothetical protein
MTSVRGRWSAPQIVSSRESLLGCVVDEKWKVSMPAAAARRSDQSRYCC